MDAYQRALEALHGCVELRPGEAVEILDAVIEQAHTDRRCTQNEAAEQAHWVDPMDHDFERLAPHGADGNGDV